MKYFEKRLSVEAVQFTGLKSVQDIKYLCRGNSIRYEDGVEAIRLWIEFDKKELNIVLQRGDYAVRDRGRVFPMSEQEFESKYELAGPANEYAQIVPQTNLCGHPGAPISGTIFNGAAEPKRFNVTPKE